MKVIGRTVIVLAAGLLFACTPITRIYEIHTDRLTCEQANRYVHDSLRQARMTVTAFRLASPGSPGFISAERHDKKETISGTVKIFCDANGVHIVPSENGMAGEQYFERVVFLSITGRADLSAEDVRAADLKKKPAAPAAAGVVTVTPPPRKHVELKKKAVGVIVTLEPIRGFSTVLDFEANLSAADLLPVKVRIENGSSRHYRFHPADVVLRRAGKRLRAYPLEMDVALSSLRKAGRRAEQAGESLGDVKRAAVIMERRLLHPAQLEPGQVVEGFVYYSDGDYDRARVIMADRATGETEGFLVELEDGG